MPEVRKVLGQRVPAVSTLEDLYVVPPSTEAVVSTLIVCNSSGAAVQFRASVAPGGTADAGEQYMYWDFSIPPGDSFAATIGITISSGDVVRCYSNGVGTAFQVFGVEISP